MNLIKKLFLFFIIFILSNCCAHAEKSVISEQYYLSKIQDKKIGYISVLQTKDDNKITTNKHIEQYFNRFGNELKTVKDYKYEEDLNGKPISAEVAVVSAGEDIKTTVTFSPDKMIITRTSNGITTQREVALTNNVIFPYAVQTLILNNLNKNQFSYYTLDPNNDFRLLNVTYDQVKNDSGITYNNETLSHFKVSIDLLPNLSNDEWYNSKGKLVKKYSQLFNIQETLVPKKQIEVCENNNISLKNLISVDTYIKSPNDVQQITYKITAGGEMSDKLFITDDRQRVIQSFNNITFLKVTAEKTTKDKYKYPFISKGLSKYLSSDPYIKTSSAKIKDTVKELTSKSNDSYLISKNMEKWVGDYLTKNELSNNFNDTDTILKNKSGNSLEYSILLASLLRAANIPAKIATGLVYIQSPETAFSSHFWVKAYIGKWINLDSYYPTEPFSPLHITMKENDLGNIENKNILMNQLLKTVSCYKISILNYDTVEKPVANIKLSENADSIEHIESVNFYNKPQDKTIGTIKLNNYTRDEFVRIGFYNFSQGNIEQATTNFQKADEIVSINDDFSNVQLAKKLATLGLFELAEKNMETVSDTELWGKQVSNVKLNYFPQIVPVGNNQIAYAKAISAINYQNNPDLAINIVLKMPENVLEGSDYGNYVLAKAYSAKKDYAKAEKFINIASLINNRNLNYKKEKVDILLAQKRFKEAIRLIEEIQNLKTIDEPEYNILESKKYSALSELQVKKELKDYYLAKSYYIDGEYSKASELLKQWISKNSTNNDIYTLNGLLYMAQNDNHQAKEMFDKALKLDKSDYNAYIGLGDIEFKALNYDKALLCYKNAAKHESDGEISTYKQGLTCEMTGNIQKALEYYQKANLNENNYLCFYRMGKIQAETDEVEKAVKNLKKSASINPLYSPTWIELSKLAIQKNNSFSAIEYLLPVKYINHEDANYYYVSGLISIMNDNKKNAIKQFKKALIMNPDLHEAQSELAKLELDN
jgi:tetratricopeptide (TPR) repeat protein